MVLGIRVARQNYSDSVTLYLFVSEQKNEELFFSNKKIRQAIEKNPSAIGLQIWEIIYTIDFANKTIISDYYYPKTRIISPLKPIVEKTGFAALAELTILKQLAKDYPDFYLTTTLDPDKRRRKQLEKHGRVEGETLPIKEAIRRLENYVRRRAFIYRHRDNIKPKLFAVKQKNRPKLRKTKPR